MQSKTITLLLAQLRDSAADESYKAGVYIDVTVQAYGEPPGFRDQLWCDEGLGGDSFKIRTITGEWEEVE